MNFGWNPEDPSATFGDTEIPSYKLDYFGELTTYDMFESNQASWNLEELGYAYDAPHFHPDGRIEGGLHPPEYYAYSPHPGSWQDGLQDIDDFDWPSEQYDHPLSKTQSNPEQGLGEASALEGVVSTQATTTGESSVPTHQVSDQVKPHQPEVNLDDQVENLDWLSPSIENAPAPDTSTPAASSPPSTSPPSIPDSILGQVSKSSVLSFPISLDAQADVVDSKEQDEKASDRADELQTSLVGKYDDAEQQGVEETSESRVLQDENSSNSEATSGIDITPGGDNTTSVKIPASSTPPAAETSDALPSPDTKSEQPVQEPSEVHCINGNPMSPGASDSTHIADVVPMSGGLEELSLLQTEDDPKEERLLGQAEPVENLSRLSSISLPPQRTAREIPRKSDLGTGPSNAAALPAADLPKSPIGKTPNSQSPENLAHVEDDAGAQWQAQLQDAADEVPNGISGLASPGQQCARIMTLPPLSLEREEDVNDEQGSETSALSDAPSFDTSATLCFTPDGLARNSTTVVPTEGASSDGSVLTSMNTDTPTKTLRLRLKVDSIGSRKRSKPAKKAISASDTDSDAPPKKKQRQGTNAEPSLQPPRNPSGQIIFGTEAELQQPDNDDGDTEEHYSDVETPTTPPGQAFVHILSTKAPRSRPKVSNRELEGLTPTKYRERPPKARNQSQPIVRQLFASQQKPDALGMLLTSKKALEESPAVPKNEDTLILVEGAGTAGSTAKVSTRSKKKTPAGRATRKKKVSAVEEEPASRQPRKTSAPKNAGETQPTASPNIKKTTTHASKSKSTVLKDTEKDEILVSTESEPPAETPTQDKIESASEYAESPHAQETSEADDESCATTPTVPKKNRTGQKNKALALGARAARRNKQRNDTPAASVVTLSGTPGANKYGFTPRRGLKAAAGPGLIAAKPAAVAAKTSAAASSKMRAGVAKGKGGMAGGVSMRKTRRGSKREGEVGGDEVEGESE